MCTPHYYLSIAEVKFGLFYRRESRKKFKGLHKSHPIESAMSETDQVGGFCNRLYISAPVFSMYAGRIDVLPTSP